MRHLLTLGFHIWSPSQKISEVSGQALVATQDVNRQLATLGALGTLCLSLLWLRLATLIRAQEVENAA